MSIQVHPRGFTLVELMIVVAVSAILIGVGVPAMKTFLDTNRRAAAVNGFVTDIQRARSTAAARATQVVMCTATSRNGCSGDTSWENGWLVFIDTNANDTFDSGTDTRLNFHASPSGIRMPGNGSTGLLRFSPGFLSMFGNISVAVCVDNDNENGRRVVISNTGRPRLEKMTAATPAPNCL